MHPQSSLQSLGPQETQVLSVIGALLVLLLSKLTQASFEYAFGHGRLLISIHLTVCISIGVNGANFSFKSSLRPVTKSAGGSIQSPAPTFSINSSGSSSCGNSIGSPYSIQQSVLNRCLFLSVIRLESKLELLRHLLLRVLLLLRRF